MFSLKLLKRLSQRRDLPQGYGKRLSTMESGDAPQSRAKLDKVLTYTSMVTQRERRFDSA